MPCAPSLPPRRAANRVSALPQMAKSCRCDEASVHGSAPRPRPLPAGPLTGIQWARSRPWLPLDLTRHELPGLFVDHEGTIISR